MRKFLIFSLFGAGILALMAASIVSRQANARTLASEPTPTPIASPSPSPSPTATANPVPTVSPVPEPSLMPTLSPSPSPTLAPSDGAARISLADAKAAYDAGTAVFVDTRTGAAYKTEHFKGAVSMPLADVATADFSALPKGKTVIAYCS